MPNLDALEQLVTLYCDAWNETNPARRLPMLERALTADGVYVDPMVRVTGPAELGALIGSVLEKFPGSRIVCTSWTDAHHDVLRFTWQRVAPDGTVLRDGVDFCTLSADGTKLALIAGFFGPVEAR